MRFAALAYEPNERLLKWLTREIEASKVVVRLSTEATPALLATLSPDDVIGFYYTLAARAGAVPQRRQQDDSQLLAGANWLVHARPVAGGLSQVDLVVGAR